jgi:hypothetical protein
MPGAILADGDILDTDTLDTSTIPAPTSAYNPLPLVQWMDQKSLAIQLAIERTLAEAHTTNIIVRHF